MIPFLHTQPSSSLDLLPAEVLHTVFDYLWAQDILYSFSNTSDYLAIILSNYDNYHVDFKSILKQHFDSICRQIRPDQITSLVLSDSDDTPGQCQTFLSIFPINRFARLRALTLIAIDNDSQPLFSDLYRLEYLVSFEVDTMSHLQFIESSPRLQRLIVNNYLDDDYHHEKFLSTISFSYLCSLSLPHCSYTQLRQILSHAPKLISLNISLVISDCLGIDYFAEQHQDTPLAIIHLDMSIQTFTRTISRLPFERFLSRMPRLRKLELVVPFGGSTNLLDGDQWETFILDRLPFLSTFDFKFKIINIDRNKHDEESVLTHFRSPFWLKKDRRWYTAYNAEDLILYTVPRFSPRTIKHPFYQMLPHATTLPIEQRIDLYHRVTEVELGTGCKATHRYTQVQKLTLLIPNIDENMIDISWVEYLCVKTAAWSLKKLFQLIKQQMPRLYHLKIDCGLSWTRSRNMVPLEQIRILELPQFSSSTKNDQVDLSLLFPHVERLTIEINNCYQMVSLIDRLKHLSSSSFHIINCKDDMSHKILEAGGLRRWLVETTRCLAANNNFTYRLDFLSSVWIHLWINQDVKEHGRSSNTQSTSGQGDKQRGRARHCLLQ